MLSDRLLQSQSQTDTELFVGHPLNDYWMYLPNTPGARIVWFRAGGSLFVQLEEWEHFSCYLPSRAMFLFIQRRFNAKASFLNLGVTMAVQLPRSAFVYRARFAGNAVARFDDVRQLFGACLTVCQRSLQPLPGIAPPLPQSTEAFDTLGMEINYRLTVVNANGEAVRRALELPSGAVELARDLVSPTLQIVADPRAPPPPPAAERRSPPQGAVAWRLCRETFRVMPQLAPASIAGLVQRFIEREAVAIWSLMQRSGQPCFWLRSGTREGSLAVPFIIDALVPRVPRASRDGAGLFLRLPASATFEPELREQVMQSLDETILALVGPGGRRGGRDRAATASAAPAAEVVELSESMGDSVSLATDQQLKRQHNVKGIYYLELSDFPRLPDQLDRDRRLGHTLIDRLGLTGK